MIRHHHSNDLRSDHPDYDNYIKHDLETIERGPEAVKESLKWHHEWLATMIVGRPRATEYSSVEELEGRDMVGLYKVAVPNRRAAIEHTKQKRKKRLS